MERLYQEIIPFETHSSKSLPNLAILKNFNVFFFEKTICFSKKSQILKVSRIIPVTFCGKVATIWRKNNFKFRCEQTADVGVNAIGEHRVKKTQPFERKILLPYFKYAEK